MHRLLFALVFFLLSGSGLAQSTYSQDNFDKKEVYIGMRDGVRLYTAIYTPKDSTQAYPILMMRTPYSCRPYGPDQFPDRLGPSPYLMKAGYIFVYQDVRGRWMSEGQWTNMTPHIRKKKDPEQVDESSDTYDTIEWLLANLPNHNGKVGQWGISYPGFYTTAGALEAHPALVASSPQAPIGDFFFDDFHHNGAYLLSYWRATTVFGYQTGGPTPEAWYTAPDLGTPDQYQFFLDAGPLKNLDKYYEDNFFWQELKAHPNYDEFWQKRGIIQHLDQVTPNTLVVGGWFDAEDLFGPLMTYSTIEKEGPGKFNALVMGPWSHGDWARDRKRQAVGNVYFGDSISHFYQREIEAEFFNHFLKGEDGEPDLPEAYVYDTGKKEWAQFDEWPPRESKSTTYYLLAEQELSTFPPVSGNLEYSEFISDPAKPVPYTEDIKVIFTPRKYMSDDQRFAARRPDVLIFETEPLEEDVTLAGPILVDLRTSTTGEDADWVVKLIDVLPPDHPDYEETQDHLRMGNYHMLVRSEVMRARFRNSFEKPEPLRPGRLEQIDFKLQDVFHTFKKGHRIQIQVQSTWFPLIDRNPQTFVDNIFEAEESDFKKQTHRIYHVSGAASSIQLPMLKR